jgi:hypothetical protein
LDETGAKLEKYSRRAHQLETKCEDYEKFFANSLATLYDAGQHVALSLTSAINNATANLNDAARHSSEGLTKQIQHVVEDARAFLAGLKENGPRPSPAAPKPKPPEIKLDPEAEQKLADFISRRPTTATSE